MNPIFHRNHQRVFGTFPLKGAELEAALATAIEVGYRHVDTAQMYANEAAVGAALAASGLPRAELFVTTKVPPANYAPDRFMASVEQSLADLRLDQVDLLLVHWPPFDGGDVAPSLEQLAAARERGLARHIGISNYTSAMMERAVATIGAGIACNQVEFHPLLDQGTLLAASAATGIPLTAYCSVARGEALKHPEINAIAAAYGKSAGQVTLRWILQKGVAPITMSTKPANIRANYAIMDFTLASVDMARIDRLNQENFRVVTKDLVPGAPDWD